MNVGLPGTGIGGLFYLMTTFIILLSELVMTVRGQSSKQRWSTVMEQTGMTVSMIIMAILTNMLVSTYLLKKRVIVYPPSNSLVTNGINLYAKHPILVPITLLFIVLIVIQIFYFTLRMRSVKPVTA
jgi:protein-S-isoprenylcysteine O-methyltransferase Ste14